MIFCQNIENFMAKKKNTIRIYSWNVNGIRAAAKKGFVEWLKKSRGDIVCIQETKAQPEQIPDEIEKLKNYNSYWFSAERKGYSSVGLLTKIKPLETINGFGNPKFDCEGRVIFAEYEKFLLVNVYFPNGGRGPERVKYKLDFYDELFFYLQRKYFGKKGIIVTGDYNTAHNEIDLARPKENENNTGFLKEEREWIDNIINLGYVDIFRKFNKNPGNVHILGHGDKSPHKERRLENRLFHGLGRLSSKSKGSGYPYKSHGKRPLPNFN